MNHDPIVDAAIAAVAAACQVTRRVQGSLGGLRGITKDDKSPVTVADFAAQAVVGHLLAGRLQDLALPFLLVGEESSALLREPGQRTILDAVVGAVQPVWPGAGVDDVLSAIDRGNHDASGRGYWTLDPVDGTKGFLRGGQYAVSLARIEDGEVVLGVMGCPNLGADFGRSFDDPDPTGLLFFARRGGGAFCVPADRPGAPPRRVASDPGVAHAIRVCELVESGHTDHDAIDRIVERLGGAGTPARLDSQAKYAVVARGQSDAYIRIPGRPGYVEKIWDHAAGMRVAIEAGARVSDIRGRPLDFSRGMGLASNHGIVCAGAGFHDRIIEAIRGLAL